MTMALQVSQQDVTARIFKLPVIRHVRFVLFACVFFLLPSLAHLSFYPTH